MFVKLFLFYAVYSVLFVQSSYGQFSNFKLKSFHSFYSDFNNLYFHINIIIYPEDIIMLVISIIYVSTVEPDTFQLKYVTIAL